MFHYQTDCLIKVLTADSDREKRASSIPLLFSLPAKRSKESETLHKYAKTQEFYCRDWGLGFWGTTRVGQAEGKVFQGKRVGSLANSRKAKPTILFHSLFLSHTSGSPTAKSRCVYLSGPSPSEVSFPETQCTLKTGTYSTD